MIFVSARVNYPRLAGGFDNLISHFMACTLKDEVEYVRKYEG